MVDIIFRVIVDISRISCREAGVSEYIMVDSVFSRELRVV